MIIYTNKYNGARPVAIPSVAFSCHANRFVQSLLITAVNVLYKIVKLRQSKCMCVLKCILSR